MIGNRLHDFDFSFPIGAYGHSSAWSAARGVSLFRYPELAPRRLIQLKPVSEADVVIPPLSGQLDDEKTRYIPSCPFYRKIALAAEACPATVLALTSGAGSALFKTEDRRTFKFKRCGLGEIGFHDQGVKGSSPIQEDDEFYDYSGSAISGLMSRAAAETEFEVIERLKSVGISSAYTPVGIVLPHASTLDGFDVSELSVAAILVEVESDLRVDELFYMTITPLLASLFSSGQLTFDAAYEGFPIFDSHGVPFFKTRASWAHVSERLRAIGIAVGAAYRRCHDAGFLRGLTACWPGNEVVHQDGRISLIDFDGGAFRSADYPASEGDLLRKTEIQQYCSDSYLFFTVLRPRTLQLYGQDFIEGCWAGYNSGEPVIDAAMLVEILADHFENAPPVWQGFGLHEDLATPIPGINPTSRLGVGAVREAVADDQ